MKKILKFFGLISLICFSFFYTDEVMNVVSMQDPLKLQIDNLSLLYKISPNEAVITEKTIIPGSNGRVVNINKSYNKMKKSNVFNENLLVYDILYPEYTLASNLDKYVIGGNINNNMVSIIFIVMDDKYIDKIIDIADNKNIILNLFIDYTYLNNNINKVKSYKNHNIYSYQEEYSYEKLVISNNIIKMTTNNKAKYCLVKSEDENSLNVCSYCNMNTIMPSIKGNLIDIKNNLQNGSIILLETNYNTIYNFEYITNFIKGKGYDIVSLDTLLSE